MAAIDVLCDVIAFDMDLDPSRVVIYDGNYQAPNDQDIYITVAFQSTKIISSVSKFEPADSEAAPPTVDREVKTVVKADTFNIEITSKNEDALSRYHEVVMALTSNYGQQQMEENNLRIFRTGQVLDLSFIEGVSALHRYRIPVIIHNIERKEREIETFDKFQAVQEEIDVP